MFKDVEAPSQNFKENKMSICFTVDIMCNGDVGDHICAEWVFGTVQYHTISGTRESARKKAKAAGWVYKDGKDYCPDCAKKIGRKGCA